MYRYRVYDLSLEAEFALPELAADDDVSASAPADVVVRLGAKGARPELGGRAGVASSNVHDPENDAPESWVAWDRPQSMLTHFTEAGRYLVSEGREVVVYPHVDADPDRVRHMLLGPVLAQVLWQRGLFALHGAVLEVGDKRFAFVGASGEGKSTLALALLQAGHTLFCDDVAVLDWQARPVLVRPSFPRLRAHADTLAQLNQDRAGLAQAHRELEKWLVPARQFATQPKPLDRIYVLATCDQNLCAEHIEPGQAMMALLRQTYYAQQFAGLYGVSQHLARAGALAQAVPVYRLLRPKRWQQLAEVVQFIEAEARR